MRRLWTAGALGAVLGAVSIGVMATSAACGDGERPPSTQTPAPPARPAFRLVVVTDVDGYLEPCGCQSRPLGGIDKAAERLRALGGDGVPALFVSAGDLFANPDSHSAPTIEGSATEAATQAKWQAETLAAVLGRMSLAAAAPGPADLHLGAAAVQDLAKRGAFSWLCDDRQLESAPARGANGAAPASAVKGPCVPSIVVARGGLQVGIWGLGASPAGAAAAIDALALAKQRSAELRARGADVVIGLWSGDARLARRITGATPGLDFLVHGGADSAEVVAPERIGDATLLRASHQGHGLLVADVFHAASGPFVDVGAWTRAAQQQALEKRVSELDARIREWRRDPQQDRGQVAEQEARLARLRTELTALRSPARPQGNAFSAQFFELGPEAPADADTRALLNAHDKRVNEHNREALAGLLPKPVPAGDPGYVGATRCADCHETEAAWWKGHAHGHAYRTLEQRDKQFNLSCVGCHVTGYGQPGGAAVVRNQGLTDVGCESCHGPGSLHAQDPDIDAPKNVQRDAPEAVCRQCHTPEHSDRFAYTTYRAKLIVPGHGLPAEKAAQ